MRGQGHGGDQGPRGRQDSGRGEMGGPRGSDVGVSIHLTCRLVANHEQERRHRGTFRLDASAT